MRTLFWVLLLAGVGMGQTPPIQENSTTFTEQLKSSPWTWAQYVIDPERFTCDTVIDFGKTAKTVRELFPEACQPDSPSGAANKRSDAGSSYFCTTPSTGGTCAIAEAPADSVPPANPWTVVIWSDGPYVPPPQTKDEVNWQAIADHCHVEELVHHLSAEDMGGIGYDPPILAKPVPDSWEVVSRLRIVCK